MSPRPADLCIHYRWREGSVPPPFHYEYQISLGPGLGGSIEFLPDYPMYHPPVWTETFTPDDGTLDTLYRLILEKRILTRRWTELENGPVGSSLEWMQVTAGGRTATVPSVIEEADDLRDVYQAVRSLVPEAVWTKLMARREEFQRACRQGGA